MKTELPVIADAYDLARELLLRVAKFPRSYRVDLGSPLNRHAREILTALLRAKYATHADDKRRSLTDANLELELLRFQMRLACDTRALPLKAHGHLCGLVQKVGAQVGGWLKSLGAGQRP